MLCNKTSQNWWHKMTIICSPVDRALGVALFQVAGSGPSKSLPHAVGPSRSVLWVSFWARHYLEMVFQWQFGRSQIHEKEPVRFLHVQALLPEPARGYFSHVPLAGAGHREETCSSYRSGWGSDSSWTIRDSIQVVDSNPTSLFYREEDGNCKHVGVMCMWYVSRDMIA